MNLETMTEPQRRAVLTDHPDVFCVAGPGSGKTTVLAARIRRLIDAGVPSHRIAALTYTNAAARNIEDRLAPTHLRAGHGLVCLGFAGTLHGFCLRMLREYGEPYGYGGRTGVLDDEGAKELLAAKMETAGCKDSLDNVIELKQLGRPKASGIGTYTKAALAVLSYMDELREGGLLDFDMILTEFLRLVSKPGAFRAAITARFDHLLDDEVQDHAKPDWDIVYALPIPNKFLVGDPDQAIFGFRGGRVGYCVKHAAREGVQVIQLEANFRCAQEICNAANSLIRHNAGRIQKLTQSAVLDRSGKVEWFDILANEGAEVGFVVESITEDAKGKSVAILARTNDIARPFREALEAAGTEVQQEPRSEMPPDWGLARSLLEFLALPDNDTLAFFYVSERESWQNFKGTAEARRHAAEVRKEAQSQGKTINAVWFNVPKGLQDVVGLSTLYAEKEGLTKETQLTIAEMARALPPGATMLDLALEAARKDRPTPAKKTEGVTVTTIHAAKGREWDVVYLVGMEDEVIPGTRKDADIEEERRLFFVALTRARHTVWITHAATRRANWGPRPIQEHKPSRYIGEALT